LNFPLNVFNLFAFRLSSAVDSHWYASLILALDDCTHCESAHIGFDIFGLPYPLHPVASCLHAPHKLNAPNSAPCKVPGIRHSVPTTLWCPRRLCRAHDKDRIRIGVGPIIPVGHMLKDAMHLQRSMSVYVNLLFFITLHSPVHSQSSAKWSQPSPQCGRAS